MDKRKPVFINLLTIARYDHMPDYPIQFMTVGNLDYTNPEEALLQYEETQQDEETGAILKSDISLALKNGRITMERREIFPIPWCLRKDRDSKAFTIHPTVKWIWLYLQRKQPAVSEVRKAIYI